MLSDLLRGFSWTTPFVADACARLERPIRLGPAGLRALQPSVLIAGPARPAKHAGSTDVFLEAIALSSPGDVLVIDNVGRVDEGCIGDLVVGEAKAAGLAGIVVWGAHRDTTAIERLGLPVWSLGTCPAGPQEVRGRSVHALEAASLGGHVTVTRDDYVFADVDGVVVVAGAELHEVITAARNIAEREQHQAERLANGERLRDQLRLDAYLARRQADADYTFREHLKTIGGAIEI